MESMREPMVMLPSDLLIEENSLVDSLRNPLVLSLRKLSTEMLIVLALPTPPSPSISDLVTSVLMGEKRS